ncbi:hypothetical protein V492_00598 [Pseudogymnoascus sp. VKM F-4246]|nr:hypothetical protein V492_00598 [Pseudogymnoascus sp. VKM F-4246]
METTPLLAEAEAGRCDIIRGDSNGNTGFDLNGSLDNPLEWPASFKWGIVGLLAFASFTTTFSCMSVAPVANRIVNDLGGSNDRKSPAVLLVTIWELGEAAGPILIAPLSEMYGRWPVFNVANMLLLIATVLGCLSKNTAVFMASRALMGMTVAANVLNPAVVGDLFAPEQRGTAMSFIMLAPLIASSVGPAFSSAITENLGWRAVLWIGFALAALCELAFLTCFRETYKVSILRRKVTRLRRETSDTSSIRSFRKDTNLEKGSKGLWTCIMRPAVVFIGSGVLAALSLFGSVIFSYIYIVPVTLPTILEEVYLFSPAKIGSVFLANGLGTLIGVIICKFNLDRIYTKLSAANKGVGLPEYRLPLSIIGVFTLPPAVALYGWCAEFQLPLALFILSVVWIRVSMTLALLPLMPYVVDACGLYSASALTGVVVTRCLAGAFLPLATAVMIERLGYGWGFTMLAMLTMTVGLIPIVRNLSKTSTSDLGAKNGGTKQCFVRALRHTL